MKKQGTLIVFLVIAVMALSGCMFPDSEKAANQIPYADQLAAVQQAVNQYKEDTGGLVPIKDRDMDTDPYIKYLIDFEKLVPRYMAEPPGTAYEKGGIYQYTIWDPENTAEVKLVDLNIPERMREIKIRAMGRYLPTKDLINPLAFRIDYEALGFKEEITVKSPYSQHQLPIFMTGDGELHVDYTLDLADILREEKPDVKPGDDIRDLLVERSPIVPAYSVPYTVDDNNEPVMVIEITKAKDRKENSDNKEENPTVDDKNEKNDK
ncbi:hypothetical protein GCM10007425_09770 [Lysinibacillus alkalisoli]|uniref:Uncharacterized protein n=1 Tax=Lysinibacillus alkalisoli TaxID=1911548 RepID=A0A917LF20_9BACI|nr:hypothetical protein [Lysinibacillus alkalisoli]GGG17434.1 hypothetical protein GCM10007425_09770 [Lysinibacillus alkalisoli]